jgi:hypothetical protein
MCSNAGLKPCSTQDQSCAAVGNLKGDRRGVKLRATAAT